MVHRYCSNLEKLLNDPRYQNLQIFHYCSMSPGKRENAAFLMCAFQIIVHKKTANDAWRRFALQTPFLPFRDALYGPCFYDCTILHCLRGLEKAMHLGWFDFYNFDSEFVQYHEKIDNGDLNWIIPGKLLAFSCPADSYEPGHWNPEDYVDLFKRVGITAVVRLNEKTYDEGRFLRFGINHYDLFFLDGSCPNLEIVDNFLSIVDHEPGAVAVHCKAGLGRTGTLIGCYAIKNYSFPAEDFIGWCRICRPGSVLGPQQQFLIDYDIKINKNLDYKRRVSFNIEYSTTDRIKAIYGDHGQAHRLMSAKKNMFSTPQAVSSNYDRYEDDYSSVHSRDRKSVV